MDAVDQLADLVTARRTTCGSEGTEIHKLIDLFHPHKSYYAALKIALHSAIKESFASSITSVGANTAIL